MMLALMAPMGGVQQALTQASTTRPGDTVNLVMRRTAISLTSGVAHTSMSVFRRAAMAAMDGVELQPTQVVNTTLGSIALLRMFKRVQTPAERPQLSLERTVCP